MEDVFIASKDSGQSLSKFLSLVLRHKPEVIGLTLDQSGWVDVQVLLDACNANGRKISADSLAKMVAENSKQRFAFSPDGKMIRASQGHSLDVELGYEQKPPPAVLYHGTASRFVQSIREQGLLKQGRHHVHLSTEIDTAMAVGKRYGQPVLLQVDAAKMHTDGHVFFVSENNVWLTDAVPPQYILFPD